MELKQLEYFLVACEKGSFTQAAECLYTSQPNVSKAILALEKEKGYKLVERTSKDLKVTSYYERDYIDFSELPDLQFIGTIHDNFSMEQHMSRVSLGAVDSSDLNYSFTTNSNHLMQLVLLKTPYSRFGIDLAHEQYKPGEIKILKIRNCESKLAFGYIHREADF